MWHYGWVARGESEPGSDIDLVAVLDDLVCRRRCQVKDELQAVARAAGECAHELFTEPVG